MLTIEGQRHSLSGLNPEPPNNIHSRGTFVIEVYGIDCLQTLGTNFICNFRLSLPCR